MAKEKELDFITEEKTSRRKTKKTAAKRAYRKRATATATINSKHAAKIWAAVYSSTEGSLIRDAFEMGARTRELFQGELQ